MGSEGFYPLTGRLEYALYRKLILYSGTIEDISNMLTYIKFINIPKIE